MRLTSVEAKCLAQRGPILRHSFAHQQENKSSVMLKCSVRSYIDGSRFESFDNGQSNCILLADAPGVNSRACQTRYPGLFKYLVLIASSAWKVSAPTVPVGL